MAQKRVNYPGLDKTVIPTGASAEFHKYFSAIYTHKESWESSDTPALVRLCQTHVTRERVLAELDNSTYLLSTGKGYDNGRTGFVKNPLMATLSQLDKDILALEKELMLTPKSRREQKPGTRREENKFNGLQEKKSLRVVR